MISGCATNTFSSASPAAGLGPAAPATAWMVAPTSGSASRNPGLQPNPSTDSQPKLAPGTRSPMAANMPAAASAVTGCCSSTRSPTTS